MELEAQDAEFERLFDCPEGCGRSFKREALEKHIKVCKSVFQKKQGNNVKQRGASLAANTASKGDQSEPQNGNSEQTKIWKKESENFRKMIRGKSTAKNEVIPENALPETVCDICSKHFTDQAYSRHRPLCESKKKYQERVK